MGKAYYRRTMSALKRSDSGSEFDYVLIDTPAISRAMTPPCLGAVTDGLVLVLKAKQLAAEKRTGAMHDLRAAKVRVLGARF